MVRVVWFIKFPRYDKLEIQAPRSPTSTAFRGLAHVLIGKSDPSSPGHALFPTPLQSLRAISRSKTASSTPGGLEIFQAHLPRRGRWQTPRANGVHLLFRPRDQSGFRLH